MEKIKSYIYRFLRFSEKYTKTDMIYATKSSSWLVFTQIIGVIVSFVLSVLFARYLSKEVFGTYRYVISMVGFASSFSLTGINSAVTRAVAQGFGGVFKKSFRTQALWAIPYFLILLGFSIYYFLHSNNIYGFSFLITALCAPVSGMANTYNAFLGGAKDFKKSALYGSISNIIYFIGMAGITIYYPNAIILIAGYYVTAAATNFFFCIKTIRSHAAKNLPERVEDIEYSKSLSIMNVASMVAQQIDSVVIFHFLGPVQLAIYSFSTTIPDRIRSVFGIIATVSFPKLAERDTNLSRSAIKQKVFVLILLSIAIICLYIVVAPTIYRIFFPQYLETVFYSQVFSLSLLAIASNISVPALFTQKKQGGLYIISIGLPIFKIIISIVGIIFWGIWGALCTKILYHIFHIILSTYIASRPISSP